MNREKYNLIKSTIGPNHISEEIINNLEKIKNDLPPVYQKYIKYIIKPNKEIDFDFLRQEFSIIQPTEQYLTDVITTFFLIISQILQQFYLEHVFIFPYCEKFTYFKQLYEILCFSIITLLYNKTEWSPKEYFDLSNCVIELSKGNHEKFREYLIQLQVIHNPLLSTYESKIESIPLLTPSNWGPIYWRLIHLMAEGIAVRNNDYVCIKEAKENWRSFVVNSLDQFLLCGICSAHYKTLLIKYKKKLLEEENKNYPKLWFQIHNEVSQDIQHPLLTENEFYLEQKNLRKILKLYEETSNNDY